MTQNTRSLLYIEKHSYCMPRPRSISKTESYTVRLNKSTQQRLKKLGSMGDCYDSVIVRLIDFYDEYMKQQRAQEAGESVI